MSYKKLLFFIFLVCCQEIGCLEHSSYENLNFKKILEEANHNEVDLALAYEKIGDIYLANKDYITATTFYSNSLKLITNHSDDLFINRLWQKLTNIELKQFNISQTKNSYSNIICDYQIQLQFIRQQTSIMLSTQEPIQTIYQFIQSKYKLLLQKMVSDLIAELGKPNEKFALISYGSLAKQLATPYSDVEIAFLIGEDCSEVHRSYVENLAKLLTIRLIAIGETSITDLKLPKFSELDIKKSPSPLGFMLDAPRIYSLHLHLFTPQQIFNGILDNKTFYLNTAIFNPLFITGDSSLIDEYQQLASEIRNPCSTGLNVLLRDLDRWSIKKQFRDGEPVYSIKHDFYRPITIILENLSFNFVSPNSNDYWSIIECLESNEIIDSNLAVKLTETLDAVVKIRLEAYLKAGMQKEWIKVDTVDDNLQSFVVDERILFEIHSVLSCLYNQVKDYLMDCFENNNYYKPSFIWNDYEFNTGQVQLAWLNISQSKNNLTLESLGMAYLLEEDLKKARVYFKKMFIKTNKKIEKAQAQYFIGLTYLASDEYFQAYCHFIDARDLNLEVLENKNSLVSPPLVGLGMIDVIMGKVGEGLNLIKNRLEIDCQFYGLNNPNVSLDYYYLGSALQKISDHENAKECFQKAIAIDSLIYGNTHLRLAKYYKSLGITLASLNESQMAKKYFEMAENINKKFIPSFR